MPAAIQSQLWRRLVAELLGSALLASLVIGSGIAAQELSPGQTGLELLENAATAAAAVGAYIGAAYWFTSSTSFANPAITLGRMFSNTFAGIAPSSARAFIGAQIIGGAAAFAVIKLILYPAITPAEAARVITPHSAADRDGARLSGRAHEG